MTRTFRAAATGLALVAALAALQAQAPPQFKTGVELINVTATVSDTGGRFVPGLRKEDFRVYEDDQLQVVTQFSAERVPVSLGIALDTSGSMAGDKIQEARVALDRFLSDLLDPGDEIFLYRFSDYPVLLQGWTTDRALLSGALGHAVPNGGTAMYDTMADAVPLAAQGSRQKKAVVLISDGNDTSSNTPLADLQQLIRESEVLVYAIGIDSNTPVDQYTPYKQPPPQPPAAARVPARRVRFRSRSRRCVREAPDSSGSATCPTCPTFPPVRPPSRASRRPATT